MSNIGRFPIITLIVHAALYPTHKVWVKSLARLRECEKVSFSGVGSALTVGGQISETNEMHFSGKLRDTFQKSPPFFAIYRIMPGKYVTKSSQDFLGFFTTPISVA